MSIPAPTVQRYADAFELGEALARTIADRAEPALASGGQFVLGCPGGRSPTTTYRALSHEFATRGVDLSNFVIAMMDDYVVPDGESWAAVPADAHYSCRRFAQVDIQAVLNAELAPQHQIPDGNVWFPDPANPIAYEQRLADVGGIDFFILASGAGDGHVAFNPPGSALTSLTRIVELAEQTRIDNLATFPDFAGLQDVPQHGVTVGIATITTHSKAAAMVLVGADKQLAFARLTHGSGYDPAWPATAFRLIEDTALYADAAATGSTAQVAERQDSEEP